MENSIRKKNTLHKIYCAVQELIKEKGNNISIKDICQKAGIGVGTFYHYYDSKDAAIFDISNPIDLYFEKNVEPLLKGKKPVEKLEIFFSYQAQFMTDYVLVNGRNDFLKALQGNLENFFSENRLTYTLLEEIVSSPELFAEWKKEYTTTVITWHLLYLTRGLIHNWLGCECNYILRDELLKHIKMTLN